MRKPGRWERIDRLIAESRALRAQAEALQAKAQEVRWQVEQAQQRKRLETVSDQAQSAANAGNDFWASAAERRDRAPARTTRGNAQCPPEHRNSV
jgi:hypothetical protein